MNNKIIIIAIYIISILLICLLYILLEIDVQNDKLNKKINSDKPKVEIILKNKLEKKNI
jgi:hypothetical protein